MKVLFGLLLLVVGWTGHAAVYGINAENFNEVYGQYSTNDNMTGVIVTNGNVPPNQGLVDVTGFLLSYSLSDGVQTLDETNSVILNFTLAVNGSNQLTAVGITVWKAPVTTQSGGLVEGIDIYYDDQFAQIFGFKDGMCLNNGGPGGACDFASTGQTNSGYYFYYDLIFFSGFEF